VREALEADGVGDLRDVLFARFEQARAPLQAHPPDEAGGRDAVFGRFFEPARELTAAERGLLGQGGNVKVGIGQMLADQAAHRFFERRGGVALSVLRRVAFRPETLAEAMLTSDQRLHAGAKHGRLEGFAQVVVAPAAQPLAFVIGPGAGGQKEQRDARRDGVLVLPEAARHLEPVQAGHHHVGDDHVGQVPASGLEPGAAVGGFDDAVGRCQDPAHVNAQVGMVVDDEHHRLIGGPLLRSLLLRGVFVVFGRDLAVGAERALCSDGRRRLTVGRRPSRRSVRGPGGRERQAHGEATARAGGAVHAERAAGVLLDEFLRERQPDAHALLRARGGGFRLKEAIEDAGLFFVSQARPGVFDDDLGAARAGSSTHRDAPARRGELERVGEQVAQHFFEVAGVEASPD